MTDEPQPILDDLFSFLDDDGVRIPNVVSREHPTGRDYIIPSPNAETGMRLTALAEIGRKQSQGVKLSARDVAKLQMDDDEEREFMEQVMGSAYHELVADGVSWTRIQRINQYAFIYFAMGEDVANKAARDGVLSGGKVRIPANRAARRAAPKAKTSRTR